MRSQHWGRDLGANDSSKQCSDGLVCKEFLAPTGLAVYPSFEPPRCAGDAQVSAQARRRVREMAYRRAGATTRSSSREHP